MYQQYAMWICYHQKGKIDNRIVSFDNLETAREQRDRLNSELFKEGSKARWYVMVEIGNRICRAI